MADDRPSLAEKVQQATTHWMSNTRTTHALALGEGFNTVRNNLQHCSISTTSAYLHDDDATRSKQMRKAFVVNK
ncbi:MAG: hypothetical protein EOP06_11985 [Proteobacteria bacterium]|nr:MAG: hypothetical protein EOP06_11985 [Pseudomonadota bacterium]